MTIDELTTLADIMRGQKVTPAALAEKVLQLHRDLEARAKQQPASALKNKTRRNLQVRIERLEEALAAKEHALAFAIKRNDVLRKQITGGAP